jgi:hypothetical protein
MYKVGKTSVLKALNRAYLRPILDKTFSRSLAGKHGLKIEYREEFIQIKKDRQVLRISTTHRVALNWVISSFDYLFKSVEPFGTGQHSIVDFSTPRFHEVLGWKECPVLFPGFSEPLVTTRQYVELLQLVSGETVMDLGAYAGLTTMYFAKAVGDEGQVIAVEADPENFWALQTNLDLFRKIARGSRIHAVQAAVWSDNEGVEFSSEGNMSSNIAWANSGWDRGGSRFELSQLT